METAVTEKDFIIQLNQLNHKLNLVKELSFKDSKSVDDVKDVLIKLKIKAMSKIRVYLLEQIYKFRKPMTNYQVPQNTMLKHKFFFEFILMNERQVAQEIYSEYVETMSKIYYSYFKVHGNDIINLLYTYSLSDPKTIHFKNCRAIHPVWPHWNSKMPSPKMIWWALKTPGRLAFSVKHRHCVTRAPFLRSAIEATFWISNWKHRY